MFLKKQRLFLFLLSCLTYVFTNAQTLYWVGGNGTFNDPQHWSLTPGGNPTNIIPNATSNLVFTNTGLNSELSVLINNRFEVNSISIQTYDRIHFVKSLSSGRLVIKSLFDNSLGNEGFNTDVSIEFNNDFQNQFGEIRSGNNALNTDFIISGGKWKVYQIIVNDNHGLYINHADVHFKYATIKAGLLDLDNCKFLKFDHAAIKITNEIKSKNCGLYSVENTVIGKKYYKTDFPTGGINALAGKYNGGAIQSFATFLLRNPSCSPGCDGQIVLTLPVPSAANYGVATPTPYFVAVINDPACNSVAGTTSGPGTLSLTGVCTCTAAAYGVQIFDNAGNFLEQLNVNVGTVILSTLLTSTNVSCFGSCNGIIRGNVIGGTAPYTLTYTPPSPGATTVAASATGAFTLTSLCAGTHTILANDFGNCSTIITRTISTPSALLTNSVVSNVLCNSACTGSLLISPTGGTTLGVTPNYTVNFVPGGTFTVAPNGTITASALCAGPISATVTDRNNCRATVSSLIVQPPALTLTINQTSVSCSSICDGAASFTASGGVGPYQFSITPATGATTIGSTAGVFNQLGLCGGNYTLTVRDFNLCDINQTFNIAQPPAISVASTFTNVICNAGTNGRVVIVASGGNGGAFSYTWSPSPPLGQGTATISNLPANAYTVVASDGACSTTSIVTITQPPALTVTLLSQTVSCFGVCNGSSTLTATGGNGGYTYNWSPLPPSGQGTPIISNLCGSTSFTATVSDASLCVYPTVTLGVTQAASITPNIVPTNNTCGSTCSGSITAAPSGTAAYNYTFATAASTITAAPPYLGLCAGSYTLFYRNLTTGCTESSVTAITAPSNLLGSLSTSSLNCFNVCNGSLSGSAIGGTPGYTLSIVTPTGIVPGAALSGLCVGTYTLRITDANGCTNNTVTSTISQPPALTVTINSSSITCASGNNGVLTANVSGGTPAYSYAWSNGFGTNPNINLSAGNYTLTATDLNSCSTTATASVLAPPPIVLISNTTNVSCAGGSNGSATVTATGGSPSYTFQFNNIPSTINTTGIVSGLSAGVYIANVTDANSCTQPISFTITAPVVLSAAVTNIQNSCNACIGSATAQASGGTAPYSYAWTNTLNVNVGSLASTSNLCSGNYTVTVTDNRLCTATQTMNIAQVVVVNLAVGGTSIQCFGSCTGSAVVVPTGGVAPYTYTWSPGLQSTSTATALCSNIYTVAVRDNTGCVSTGTVNISQPLPLTATSSQTNATCNGVCNGAITANVSGGTTPYTYAWNPGAITTQSLTSVCAGSYSLTVTDINSCTLAVTPVTLTAPPPIVITQTVTNPSACIANNGSICATASGGAGGPYSYTWSPTPGFASCLTGLAAGSYSLIVRDASPAGCTNTTTALVTNPAGPSLAATIQSVNCFGGSTGAATVVATGASPFTFTWTPVSTTVTTGTSITASGLSTGTYVVLARDQNLCITSQNIVIAQSASITTNATVTAARCNGVSNGSIVVAPIGGTVPYSFNWLPLGLTGAGTRTVTGLGPLIYTLTVLDVNSCSSTHTFNVTQPPPLTLSNTLTNVRCNAACNGSIVASAGGGTPPLSYTWLPVGAFTGSSTATVFNLCPNIYTVIASDGNACTTSITVLITEPSAITSTLNLNNASCSNSCNATATNNVSGGILPYAYAWSSSTVTALNVSNLCAGNYTATVTDANGCSLASGYTVTPPAPFSLSLLATNPICNGSCSGSIATTVSGAQGSVSYTWSPTGTGQNPVGLCLGNYTVTAVDASLCATSAVASLVNPPPLIANITTTNASCASACNGRVNIIPLNATGAVNYVYIPALPNSSNLTNVCSGNYSLQITDANGCQANATFTLIDPPILTVNPSANPSTCGSSNGSITANVVGGSPSYTYSWAAPVVGTTSVVTGLAAGIYTLVVIDANNCSNTVTIPLSNSNGPSFVPITSNSLNCNNQCTGSASINIAGIVGGTPGYNVSWLPPAPSTLNPLSNLCAGGYTAQVTDANNCILFTGVNIAQPPAVITNPTFGLPSCNGTCNGSISLNPSGGLGPTYSFTWFPSGSAVSTITNACAGNYTIFLRDNGNNCVYQQNVNLPSQLNISVSTSITTNQCFGDCNATATAFNASGGAPPYTYNWSNGQNGTVATGLCNGVYALIVTDANGCFNSFNVTITSGSPITTTNSVISPSCNLCNGSSTISASGGGGSFLYTWSTGSTLTAVSGLCAGIYQVLIQDVTLGCQLTETVVINNSTGITGAVFSQNLPCNGTCNGTVTVTATGGTSPITYNWISPAVSSSVVTGLCSGVYFVQMTDAQGCLRTSSVSINPIVPMNLTSFVTPPSCGASDGSIRVIIAGGTPAYAINWNPPIGVTATVSGVPQGSYTITVTESGPNACSVSLPINLNNSTAPIVTATQSNINCYNACTGAITTTVTGVTPFTYRWSNGSTLSSQTNLCKGVITLSVTDGNNCVSIRSFTLIDNLPILSGVPQITQPSCNLCNGAAITDIIGGTLPYTYTWTTGANSASLSGLCAGLYQVDVTDALGCRQTSNIIMNNSSGISGQTFSVQGLPCAGTCNGSATVTALGGTSPIVYNWISPAVTNSVINNLCAGSYFVQMTDAAGCIRTASTSIAPATSLSISPTFVLPGCQASNGSIVVTISGGTPAYNISWAPISNSTRTLSGIGLGSYSVTVTESGPNNCSITQQFNLSNTTGPVVTAVQSNINCFGTCTGSIAASASGSGPFTFNWSVGGNTASLTNLCSGVITLTVTDANNCVTIRNFTISENTPILVNVPLITQPACNLCNGSATINTIGGSLPYSYLWTNAATGTAVSGLCAGLYQVSITDNLNCNKTQDIIINNSSGITGQNTNVRNELCLGSCNGAATVTAVGGAPPISYSWINPAVTNSVVTNLCNGTYFVQMSDANGCIRTASVFINSATNISLTAFVNQPSCGATNGSVNVIVVGGTPPYVYNWLPSGNTASLNNIGVGSYTLTVTDQNGSGCAKTQVVSVSNFNAPAITFTQTNISCFDACTGSVAAVASGTGSPFTYNWSNGNNNANVNNLCKGVVVLTVTASNGCRTVRSFTITDNPKLNLALPNLVRPDCAGGCNGIITLIATGGSLPYTYSWSPSGTGNPLSSACAGNYTTTITDSRGCVSSNTLALSNPAPISVTSTPINSSCSSVADGSISIIVVGGVPAYTFTWTGPAAFQSSQQNISNIRSGTYSLTMSDNTGCKRDTILTLTPTLSITARAGRDTVVCSSGLVVLTGANSIGAVRYNWSLLPNSTPVSNAVSFSPPVSNGNYTFVLTAVSSVSSCIDRDTVVIRTFPELIIDAGPDALIPLFSNVTIGGNPTAQGAVSLTWSPTLALDDASVSNPIASNTVNVVYTLTARDANGCVASDTIRVDIYPGVKISSGFTPNGDGKNDLWIIDYIEQFPDNTVEIYNRWGDQLFYSKGYETPFNGQYRGRDLPVGTYYYIINLNHPAYPKAYTGPLTVFR